jgi:hypothetical protein
VMLRYISLQVRHCRMMSCIVELFEGGSFSRN